MKDHLPGHVGPWKSIKEVKQILRDLGMRQVIYAPVFEGPDQNTFAAGIKAKILHFAPQHWYPC